MKVKTADLKNNLSRYLKRLRQTGDTIIVCDRDKPVATLAPIADEPDREWDAWRQAVMEKAGKADLAIDLPVRRPDTRFKPRARPTAAPDGRTDLRTIDLVRRHEY